MASKVLGEGVKQKRRTSVTGGQHGLSMVLPMINGGPLSPRSSYFLMVIRLSGGFYTWWQHFCDKKVVFSLISQSSFAFSSLQFHQLHQNLDLERVETNFKVKICEDSGSGLHTIPLPSLLFSL